MTQWDQVDWFNTRDSELAKQFNLTPERIRQIREQLGKPRYKGIAKVPVKNKNYKYNWDQIDWNKSNVQIAKELGTSTNFISKKRRALRQPRSRKFHWDNIDWTKQNDEIAKELGCNPSYVSLIRSRDHHPKATKYTKHLDRLKELLGLGYTVPQIINKVDIGKTYIYQLIRTHKLKRLK